MGLITLHEAVRPAVTLATAVSIFAALPCAGGDLKASGPEATVRGFVEAFNGRDADAMAATLTEDFEWLSISGSAIATEDKGPAAARASMIRYFAECPSCRSTLEWTKTSGSRVVALEHASWTAKDGSPTSQTSISVYELEGTKIRRVYYFPAEK